MTNYISHQSSSERCVDPRRICLEFRSALRYWSRLEQKSSRRGKGLVVMETFDFSRSFLRFLVDLQAQPAITLSHKPPTSMNQTRIAIECRCELINLKTESRTVFALSASCKTERVGAGSD